MTSLSLVNKKKLSGQIWRVGWLLQFTGHGTKWKVEWNGNFSGLWNMEDARMEWKISRMEWKTIFHTSIPIPY